MADLNCGIPLRTLVPERPNAFMTHSPLKSSRRHSPQLSGTIEADLSPAQVTATDGTSREQEPTSNETVEKTAKSDPV